jgi:hypothetical protein
MRAKIVASCTPRCGVLVQGEVETSTREFIHRFAFPAGSAGGVKVALTEVDDARLTTFAPDSKYWYVECPLCGSKIRIEAVTPRP